jgi:hypothetical protein
MTLREAERRHRQSERDRALDDDRIMSFQTWCEVNDFSESTGHRLRKAGRGPKFVQTSDRRIGVSIGENRRWQAARALPAT